MICKKVAAKWRRRIGGVTSIACACLGSCVSAQTNKIHDQANYGQAAKNSPHKSIVANIQQMDDMNDHDRKKVSLNFTSYYIDLENEIFDQFDSKDTEVASYAAVMLGSYGNYQATSALVDRITLQDPWPMSEDTPSLWQKYSATEALQRIGISSLGAVVKKFASSQDPAVREQCKRQTAPT